MVHPTPGRKRPTSGLIPLVIVVILVGANLRGPITGVPPLLSDIRTDLGLDPTQAGLVTALPLLAFAVFSPLVAPIAQRVGLNRALLLSLMLLGLGIVVRPWFGAGIFLAGTALVGLAITIGNVVLPVIIRRDAPERIPTVMAVSTASYGIGQGLIALLAVPVAVIVGWRWSVTAAATLTVIAIIAWIIYSRASTANAAPEPVVAADDTRQWLRVFAIGDAWWVAIFFGLQALLFYTATTWIPDQLVDLAGVSQVAAGNGLTIFHFVGIAGSLAVPVLLRSTGNPVRLGVALGLGWGLMFAGLYLVPNLWVLWMAFGGIVQGAGISLALTLIAMRPVSVDFGRYLSGMAQGVGYCIAAIGPLLVGWLFDSTGSWLIPTIVMVVLSVGMAVTAPKAGASEKIGARTGT